MKMTYELHEVLKLNAHDSILFNHKNCCYQYLNLSMKVLSLETIGFLLLAETTHYITFVFFYEHEI